MKKENEFKEGIAMKHELLVPSGNMESLYQAVANGADAVYIGGKEFSARKFASNFTKDEIVLAIQHCHLFGVKIYATMNTLVKDCEVKSFLEQVKFLYQQGIDAILMQDFGMIGLIRELYPELEIHASTQANISSLEAAKLFSSLGVKRVVFAREMTIEEIKSINVPIEKEVFIHGALCVSYSGCCLMSSMIGHRSGNRGECSGCCRLPYKLEKNGKIRESEKYYLSMKELNTAKKIKELLNTDIKSFKIEGRMKSPEYVGWITKFYRDLIDHNGEIKDIEERLEQLKTIFNRKFTLGHLFHTKEWDLINQSSPNHIGLEIGKVIDVNQRKIKIALKKELNQYDGIRFFHTGKGFIVNYLYDEENQLTKTAHKICYVDNKIGLKTNDLVYKTQDYLLLQKLKNLPLRKIPVHFQVKARIGFPLEMIISDENRTIKQYGSIVSQAKSCPITKERIKQQMEKLGSTPFISTKTEIMMDKDIFISIKELNERRRSLVQQLAEKRMNSKKEIHQEKPHFNPQKISFSPTLNASVQTKKQLQICQNLQIDNIYIEEEKLYKEYQREKNIYYKLPRCRRNPIEQLKEKCIVSDYFDFSKGKNLIGDYGLNVMNSYSVYYLQKLGLKKVTVSVELTANEILELYENYKKIFHTIPNLEVLVYGRVENMIIKGNILNLEQDEKKYNLRNNQNKKFPVYFDGINTHILNDSILNLSSLEKIQEKMNIRFSFYDETEDEIRKIISKSRKILL